ncbi:MAG TPA: peptide deformylase [Opitutales bacterium]|jgi:peptide deformylase|nr:peptide deformylase [Opitutales bacterium]
MLLDVCIYGDPVLRKRGATVTTFDKNLAMFARDMLETMVENEGIGLAAQQVGQAKRVFVADLLSRAAESEKIIFDDKPVPAALLMPLIVINPEVEFLPGAKKAIEEGCLSFPEIRGPVPRPWSVRLRYQDLQGKPHVLETSGLLARVIQHEFDHVEGVLFIDRMDPDYVKGLEPEIKKLKRNARSTSARRT